MYICTVEFDVEMVQCKITQTIFHIVANVRCSLASVVLWFISSLGVLQSLCLDHSLFFPAIVGTDKKQTCTAEA